MAIVETLGLKGNPFEHYTAETEPYIADYAVRPPYLEAIAGRARGLSSFILFGDRGAGKSATRITVFNEIWKAAAELGQPQPFVVNLTDYASVQKLLSKGQLADKDLVNLAGFVVVEQLMVWLSSFEDDERVRRINDLNPDQRALAFALIKGFYLVVSEMDRGISTGEVLSLLNSAWTTKSSVWLSRRWDSISKIVASAIGALTKNKVDESLDISAPAEALLKSLVGDSPHAPKAILSKLAELCMAFGFTGACVLVDKVDETPATSNSAEATAKLVHPLLSHIQLLEVQGFSWIFFLWSNLERHFTGNLPVRLDKIAHTTIGWVGKSLRLMVDERIKFYSSGQHQFASLMDKSINADEVFNGLVKLAMSSPRELIKLLDTIVREHDSRDAAGSGLVDAASLDQGQDKYSLETIGSWYEAKVLQQVLRLGRTVFVNKDVQGAFRISDQGARVKIKNWEDAGLVRQDGTVPSEAGGKPVYRYVVSDAKVERIIERRLDDVVGADTVDELDEA
jgi:hypothetical protein